MPTELKTLKAKCYKKDGSKKKGATQKDFERLKFLRDAEPLSKDDLAEVQKREDERAAKDKAEYEAKLAKGAHVPLSRHEPTKAITKEDLKNISEFSDGLDVPSEHPRITKLKEALKPFTKIECHDSRQNEFVLFTRGTAITAGDVRAARKAMDI